MINRHVVVLVFALAAAAHPVPARAQGATVRGLVSATSIESSTEPSFAVAVGYRTNRAVGFEVELTHVPTLTPDHDALPTSGASGGNGRATVFSTNMRIEIAPLGGRVTPYVIGGGGVANVKEIFTVPSAVPSGVGVVIPPQSITQSSTELALIAGGGVSLLMGGHASIDIDARYLRLLGERDHNVGRFGVGFGLRF
jgi:opacity protein-like surface antigen